MEQIKKANIYSGTSGLTLPIPKRSFPPEFQDKTRLTYYASLFSSIEINSSFYKVPMTSTVEKWADNVPDDFQFTFKLWREVTHNKGLEFKPQDVDRFIEVISNVGHKKGTLLVQFPPSISVNSTYQLERLFISLQQADPEREWKVAVEFRNRSWYNEDIFDLFDQYLASIVVQDMPASATPFRNDEAGFKYLRFHGPNGGYRGSYDDGFLYEYAQYIKEWQQDGKEVYVYFNNTMGAAVENLQTLMNMLEERG